MCIRDSIRPVSAPDIQLDLVQGTYSGGKPQAMYDLSLIHISAAMMFRDINQSSTMARSAYPDGNGELTDFSLFATKYLSLIHI